MYKIYKTYKQRMEELERKHNIRINIKIIIISNIITALFVGVLVFFVQKSIFNRYKVYQKETYVNSSFEEKNKLDIPDNVIIEKHSAENYLTTISPVLIGRLINWLYVWQKMMPDLSFNSFQRFEQRSLSLNTKMKYKLSEQEFEQRKKLYAFSPDKTKCIDPFYGRINISNLGKKTKLSFDVAGVIQIINVEDKSFFVIEMYGPSFDYDEVFWINDDVFVLAGSQIKYFDDRPVSYVRIPKISIYNLSNNKVSSYYGIGVEEDSYQNFIKPELVKNLYKKVSS